MRMSDDQAFDAFKAIRWADNDREPFCYKCSCVAVYTSALAACPSARAATANSQ
jgi:hypothetical protein